MSSTPALKKLSVVVSGLSIAAILLSSALCLHGSVSFRTYLVTTNVGTLTWFVSAPFWLVRWRELPGP